jgi:hypothetical protein
MRKIYKKIPLLLAGIAIPLLSIGQTTNQTFEETEDCDINDVVRFVDVEEGRRNFIQNRDEAFWSEDFSDGFPEGWSLWGEGSDEIPWVWSLTPSWGWYNGASSANGSLIPATTTIQSPTAFNGFMKNDPDSAHWMMNDGNIPYPQNFYQTYFETNDIDFSEVDNALISWYQYYRFNNNRQLMFDISTDQGETWTNYVVNQPGVPNNTASAFDHFVEINISEVVGNESTVRFRWGWDARVYFWLLDDIMITEPLENDLVLTKANYNSSNFWVSGVTSLNHEFFRGLEYGGFHESQTREIELSAEVSNVGINTQEETQLIVNILGPNGFVATELSATVSIEPNQTDTIRVNWTIPSTPGEYTINYTLVSENPDENPANNSATREFFVDAEYYARDNGIAIGTYTSTANDASPSGDYRIGNIYAFENNVTLYGIAVYLAGTSDVDASFSMELWERFEGNSREFVESTQEVFSSVEMLDNWVILYFDDPIELEGGSTYETYLVYFESLNGGKKIYVRTAQPAISQTSRVVRPPEATSGVVISATPKIRPLHVETPVNIEEISLSQGILLQTYPNPANNNAFIEYSLGKQSNIELNVYNMSGQKVYFENLGSQAEGKYQYQLNTAKFENGVYMISLSVDNYRHVKKIIIQK